MFIIKRYLLHVNLERKVLISLSFMLVSTGFNFSYLSKVCKPKIFTSSLMKLDIFLSSDRTEKLVIFSSFMSSFWCLLMPSSWRTSFSLYFFSRTLYMRLLSGVNNPAECNPIPSVEIGPYIWIFYLAL